MKFVHVGKRLYRVEDPLRAVVDYMRKNVPNTHKFCDERGVWHIDLKYVVAVGQIQLANNGKIDLNELPKYEQDQLLEYASKLVNKKPRTSLSDDSYSILHLLPTAPRLIVDAAWKALAKAHHPDRGGDEELFKKYQAAYQRITKGK